MSVNVNKFISRTFTFSYCKTGLGVSPGYARFPKRESLRIVTDCEKKFLGYGKYYSVTEMLLSLDLSSFDTVIHNYRKSFLYVWSKHSNDLVKQLRCAFL